MDDLTYFKRIWEKRTPQSRSSRTKKLWDVRADEWERNLISNAVISESTRQRVDATARYLRNRGLLLPEDDVIDIGCGPGRFVAEFAKTCHNVVGADISSRMLEHSASYAKACGLTNTCYIQTDFNTADLDELGWRSRFDLVFSSITPAVGGYKNLKKLMDMSRGWCFNSCFVHARDELLTNFFLQEFNCRPKDRKIEGQKHWFYSLFNLLLLEGYCPETYYHDECRTEIVGATYESAQRICCWTAPPAGMSEDKMCSLLYKYLQKHADENGNIARTNICTYGWVLWDTRRHYE